MCADKGEGMACCPAGVCISLETWLALKEQFECKVTARYECLGNTLNTPDAAVAGTGAVGKSTLCRVLTQLHEKKVQTPKELIATIEQMARGHQIASDLMLPNVAPSAKFLSSNSQSVERRLHKVQAYLNSVGYNHMLQLFPVKKSTSMRGLANLARTIIDAGLPIKCLEAAVVAIYLTNPISPLVRVTVSFKTICAGKPFRHIVLAIATRTAPNTPQRSSSNYLWGAVGLSRRESLGNKPFQYSSLACLIESYKEGYNQLHHHLVKIKLSEPIPNDEFSHKPFNWNYMHCHFKSNLWTSLVKRFDA